MAKSIDVTQDWADGTYTFRLGLEQLEEHDDLLKAGPIAVLGSLVDGTFRHGAIRETLRLGLIGGGTSPRDALKLVRRYVDNRPIVENLAYAVAILGAAVHGEEVKKDEGDAPGKPDAAKPETDPDAEPGSTLPPSAGTQSPSASAPPS